MKTFVTANGRWVLVGVVLVGIGLLVVTGLGRRRGSKLYRLRMSMWVLALGLMGAGGMWGCKEGEVPRVRSAPHRDDVGRAKAQAEAKAEAKPPAEPEVMCYETPELESAERAERRRREEYKYDLWQVKGNPTPIPPMWNAAGGERPTGWDQGTDPQGETAQDSPILDAEDGQEISGKLTREFEAPEDPSVDDPQRMKRAERLVSHRVVVGLTCYSSFGEGELPVEGLRFGMREVRPPAGADPIEGVLTPDVPSPSPQVSCYLVGPDLTAPKKQKELAFDVRSQVPTSFSGGTVDRKALAEMLRKRRGVFLKCYKTAAQSWCRRQTDAESQD